MRDDSTKILFQSSLHKTLVSSSGMGRYVHSLRLSIQHSPLPTTASSTLRGALKDGFKEAVVVCDMPEPCKFPSLDICEKRFLWTHKEVDLAPYPVAGPLLRLGNTEKFPHVLGFESLDSLFLCKQGPCFTAVRRWDKARSCYGSR